MLVCLFRNNDGGAFRAVCLQRGVRCERAVGPPVVQFGDVDVQRNSSREVDRHIVV